MATMWALGGAGLAVPHLLLAVRSRDHLLGAILHPAVPQHEYLPVSVDPNSVRGDGPFSANPHLQGLLVGHARGFSHVTDEHLHLLLSGGIDIGLGG